VPYDFESRKIAEGKHPELIREVFGARTIYDAGCGPHAILVRLLNEINAASDHACGFDVAIGNERRPDRNAFYGDLVTWPLEKYWERHDLVICREVLEHLPVRDIAKAIRNLCAIAERWVYVTTRFTQARHFLDFATSDDLDPTHISIMPQAWLRHLFTLEGFTRRADLEQRLDWQHKGRVLVYERAA
jgi:hypothetical protein